MILMVQFATRGRRDQFLECLQLYVDTLSGTNEVLFNISCDDDDSSMNNQETIASIYKIYPKCFINFNDNSTKVEAINSNISERQFDVVINASDDMNPQINGWDEEIRKGFEQYFPDYDGVLHFNDGVHGRSLNTLCILGRPYYDRFGYIYNPSYKGLYCDNEFTEVAKRLKKSIYINATIIKHDHVSLSSNKSLRDDTFLRGRRHDKHDENVWNNRLLHQNLGLDDYDWYNDYMNTMDTGWGKFSSMTNICTVSDITYLHQGLALYESLLQHTKNFTLHYLCLDDESFNLLKKHQNKSLIPYYVRDPDFHHVQLDAILDLVGPWHGDSRDKGNSGYSKMCWALASYFSNFLINKDIGDITYMDSDIFFHGDFQVILDAIGDKQVGIFRHRQFPPDSNRDEGDFNVGVVHFKNGEVGRKVLDWWADAVLYNKYPHLATCGDQRYLNEFPTLAEGNIFIDKGVGHGAPWMWQLYDLRKYEEDGTINWEGEVQKLIFTHFSQFVYRDDGYVPTTMHWQYTPEQHYTVRPDLKFIYDEYYLKVREAKEKYQGESHQNCWHYSHNLPDGMLDTKLPHLSHSDHFKGLAMAFDLIEGQIEEKSLIDLGCGRAELSDCFPEYKYCGADLPHFIQRVSKAVKPSLEYIEFDATEDSMTFVSDYEVVVMNGFLSELSTPCKTLDKVLKLAKKYVIIHRQQIAEEEKFETYKTYGAVIATQYYFSQRVLDDIISKNNCTKVADYQYPHGHTIIIKKND